MHLCPESCGTPATEGYNRLEKVKKKMITKDNKRHSRCTGQLLYKQCLREVTVFILEKDSQKRIWWDPTKSGEGRMQIEYTPPAECTQAIEDEKWNYLEAWSDQMKNTFPHTRSCLICGAPHHGCHGCQKITHLHKEAGGIHNLSKAIKYTDGASGLAGWWAVNCWRLGGHLRKSLLIFVIFCIVS